MLGNQFHHFNFNPSVITNQRFQHKDYRYNLYYIFIYIYLYSFQMNTLLYYFILSFPIFLSTSFSYFAISSLFLPRTMSSTPTFPLPTPYNPAPCAPAFPNHPRITRSYFLPPTSCNCSIFLQFRNLPLLSNSGCFLSLFPQEHTQPASQLL